ncbi:MAG TPA: cbb3-type cytochrome c oxidase subunit I [Candidatus Krumholzibacteria bacterium]|nr:cbb3-type cytochrome c oxidase subunit I [Candidatus Krumholzibacteria bacterium]
MSGGSGALNTGYLGGGDGLGGWLGTRDHKRIAVMFLVWSLGVFLLGLIYALIMKLRAQSGIIDTHTYHQMLTQHGVLMVFLFVVPAIPSILGHFVLPLQLGARNMALPGFSAWSFRFYALGTLLFLVSLFAGPTATGWTFLTPFSLGGTGAFMVMAVGLCLSALGWLTTGVNIVVTVHTRREAGMGFFAMPLFSWGVYLAGYLLAVVGSLFAIIIIYLGLSRAFAGGIFGPGSDPLLWQNYFWFVTTPAAYFALLPAVGVISDIVAGIARRGGFVGYRLTVGSMIALLALSFTTWGLRMLGTGLGDGNAVVFAALNLATVVPVAIIVYCWLATLHRGAVLCVAPTTFVAAFVLQAGIGAMMGLVLASLSVGRYLANTLFVTAQSHYLMMGGVMTALLAGLHWWWPKLTGRMFRQGLGRFGAALYMVGLNMAFIPQMMQGVGGVARGTFSLPPALAGSESVSFIGVWVMITGLVLVASNLFGSLFDGQAAGANPWGAGSLEWQAASPPPQGNFTEAPAAGENPYAA